MADVRGYDYGKTDSWHEPQFVIVDGWRCVYSMQGSDVVVHLPGGVSRTVRELREAGREITTPALPRTFTPGQLQFIADMAAQNCDGTDRPMCDM